MRFLSVVVFLSIIISNSRALTLGSYKDTYNIPGYINFDHNSDVYNGPLELKNRNDNVNRLTPSQMLEMFFENDRISIKKLDEFKNQVVYMRGQAKIVFCQTKMVEKIRNNSDCKKNSVLSDIESDYSDQTSARAMDFIISKVEAAKALSSSITKNNINKKSSQSFLSNLFEAFEVYDAVKGEDEVLGGYTGMPAMLLKGAKLLKSPNIIKKDRPHAANLVRVSNVGKNSDDLFYSEKELQDLQDNGYDLSLLNPLDSGFWRMPKKAISKFNTFNYDQQDTESFKKILKDDDIRMMTDPNEVIDVTFTGELPKGGSTAKIDVIYKKAKFKMKFVTDKFGGPATSDPFTEAARVIQGSEANIESPVNNLAAALGFTVDPTYYKKKVRVYLPEAAYQNNNFDNYVQELYKKMSLRFSIEMNPTSAFKLIKTDSNGKKYFEVKAVAFEQKANKKTDLNIGSFIRHGLGKSLKREHRAFALFLSWVMDIDTKDDNDRLKLVPYQTEDGKLSYHLAFSSSDMGGALAGGNPNFFNFNLVKNYKEKDGQLSELELNHRRLYSLRILQAVNLDDAKWIVRLMSQLSPKQIKDAFLSGGYPDIIAEYFSQIMISKRNQLASVLGLLNTTTIDSEGRSVVIAPGGEFSGTIKGYEKYFVNGRLYDPDRTIRDPEVDIGKRPWGNDFSSFGGGDESLFEIVSAGLLRSTLNLAQSTLLSNLSLTNNGLTLFPLGMTGGDLLSKNCTNNCFMHGMVAGANLFIPYRYIIPNPNKDQANRYWLVDVFRIGAFLGHNGDSLLGDLGIDAALPMSVGLGAKVYKINEYIKIKPVRNEGKILSEIERWATMTAMPIKSARKAYVEGMEQDDVLIHSSYYGMQGTLTLRPQLALPISVGPSVSFSGNVLTANRVTLVKEENNTIMAAWGRLKEATRIARLNLIDFLIQVPLLEAQLKKLHSVETTYKFSLNDSNEKNILMSNLGTTTPEAIPRNLKLQNRTTDVERKRYTLSLFGLYVKRHYTSKIEVDYKDFKENITASDFALEKKYQTKKLHHGDFSNRERKVKASINSLDDLYVKINFTHVVPGAKKKEFIELYNYYSPILPENFIVFDLNAVKNYFGDLKIDSSAIFGKDGLREIFNPQYTERLLCLRYATVRRVANIYEACEDTSNKVEKSNQKMNDDGVDEDSLDDQFEDIWKKYQKARTAYWKIQFTKNPRSAKNKKETYKNLEKVMALFADNKKFKYRSLKFLVSLVGRQNFYRKSSITSSLDAFPGANDQIEENAYDRGEFEPSLRMLSDSPELAFEIFSDRIHRAVGPIFLNYAPEL